MGLKERGIKIVGQGKVGKTATTKKPNLKTTQPTAIKPPEFKTEKDYNDFMKFTKPIPLKRKVKMPGRLKTMQQFLDEYNLIMQRKSELSGSQRIVVKNVIHFEARRGTITLTTE